jgi:flagellar protein FlbD
VFARFRPGAATIAGQDGRDTPAAPHPLTARYRRPIVACNGPGWTGFTTSRDALMIVVTRLNDSHFAINPDLIERITANPDTTLIMVDGAKFIVTESMSEVIERISRYRATVIALTHELSASGHQQRSLELVENDDDTDNPVPLRPRKI